jgi:hypothetical protein
MPDWRVALAQGLLVRGLTDRNPMLAHILKAVGTRHFTAEIVDQLAQNPCLIGI